MSLEDLELNCGNGDDNRGCHPSGYDLTESEENKDELATFTAACFPIALTLGSMVVGVALPSLISKVVNYFQQDSEEDYSYALMGLFEPEEREPAEVVEDTAPEYNYGDRYDAITDMLAPIATTCHAITEFAKYWAPKVKTQFLEVAEVLGKSLHYVATTLEAREIHQAREYHGVEAVPVDEHFLAIVAEAQEYFDGTELLQKYHPELPKMSLFRKIIYKDWPQGEFEIYCDGLKRLFSDEEAKSSQGSQEKVDMDAAGEFHDDALMTDSAGDSPSPAAATVPTPVKERVKFFERISRLTGVSIDRASDLASITPNPLPTEVVVDGPLGVEEQAEDVIPGAANNEERGQSFFKLPEKDGEIPAGQQNSSETEPASCEDEEGFDLSTDSDEPDFEDHGFCKETFMIQSSENMNQSASSNFLIHSFCSF